MAKASLSLVIVLLPFLANATTYEVGSTKPYATPHALYQANILSDGDTILIDGETYTGTASLARWGSNNLFIQGVNGRPHMAADGQYILGKGIWVLAGNDITIENIEFSDAVVPDHNGAGIRLDGIGLTVRYCYFHDNEDGILTGNQGEGDILIEYSEFDHNGYGDGFSHNLYIGHNASLTFRFNYSHHAVIGHNLKSRANENYIYYNRIMDEETGSSSRLIDLPNGGFCIVMGNLLMQGDNAPNSNMVGYGQEGLSNSPNEFYFINNTLVNKRMASCLFVDIAGLPVVVHIFNNIFAGNGTLTHGVVTAMSNNLIEPNIPDIKFMDEPNYDYRLESDSPAIDIGIALDPVNGFSLTPDFMYDHPESASPRSVVNGVIDVGAYEYRTVSGIRAFQPDAIVIYPNPALDMLWLESDEPIEDFELYSASGQRMSMHVMPGRLDLSGVPSGIYYLKLRYTNRKEVIRQLMKL